MSHVEGIDDGIGYGVYGRSDRRIGVQARSNSGTGLLAESKTASAVVARSDSSHGVYAENKGNGPAVVGISDNGIGILAQSKNGTGLTASSENARGVIGSSNKGEGVYGSSVINYGIHGESVDGEGVFGRSNTKYGIMGESNGNVGVFGRSNTSYGVQGFSERIVGVYGQSNNGYGVVGQSDTDAGVVGRSGTYFGVQGESKNHPAVYGESGTSYGVQGVSGSAAGVYGQSEINNGIEGYSKGKHGIYGETKGNNYELAGVYGKGRDANGLMGASINKAGVFAVSNFSYGVIASHYAILGGGAPGGGVFAEALDAGIGVFGVSNSGDGLRGKSSSGYAAYLDGRVFIRGPLQKPGGSFKIDHPLEPDNKYLQHSFVESSDMKNIYDGVITLDSKGEAEIELPDWFCALNKDFRYQLTAIGAPGPNLHINKEISEITINDSNKIDNNSSSHFKIAGGTPGLKVSWQVTGIRKDPWANANRIQVEEDKPAKEKGYYIHPELYGQPAEKGINVVSLPEYPKQQL
jgi:hypothetical protein